MNDAVELPALKPQGSALTIDQLNMSSCRWPFGKLEDRPPYFYCGLPTLFGKPWCPIHQRIVYAKKYQ